MFAVTGITGRVGQEVARALLAADCPVRAVCRDANKGKPWVERGCDLALANIRNAESLVRAFDAEGVFIMIPANFDPEPGFPEARAMGKALRTAIALASTSRVVYLSTIGAQVRQENLLTQHTIVEQEFLNLGMPITLLRPAWFVENYSWDLPSAILKGAIQSYLQPLDKPVPMVAIEDIGRTAANLLQEPWNGAQIYELEGPTRVTPNQAASVFSDLLGHPVRMEVVPRDQWESIFRSQGIKNPEPRMRMIDGFNEGWIEFEEGESGSQKGTVTLDVALRSLLRTADLAGNQ